jgi:hypothetical protein
MTDDEPEGCTTCGRVWALVRTPDGTLYAVERHHLGCPLTPGPRTYPWHLLPDPGPQGDAA